MNPIRKVAIKIMESLDIEQVQDVVERMLAGFDALPTGPKEIVPGISFEFLPSGIARITKKNEIWELGHGTKWVKIQ
jgi:hypothetical protein